MPPDQRLQGVHGLLIVMSGVCTQRIYMRWKAEVMVASKYSEDWRSFLANKAAAQG